MMNLTEILELERKAFDERLKDDLAEAKRKAKQETLNACIGIYTNFIGAQTVGLMYNTFKDEV